MKLLIFFDKYDKVEQNIDIKEEHKAKSGETWNLNLRFIWIFVSKFYEYKFKKKTQKTFNFWERENYIKIKIFFFLQNLSHKIDTAKLDVNKIHRKKKIKY